MNYLLMAITILAINQISCIELSEPKITTDLTAEQIPESFFCTYELNYVDKVVKKFYENQKTEKAAIMTIIKTEQKLESEAIEPCSEVGCPEVSIGNASALQFYRYYGGNERAIEFMTFEVQRIFHLTNQENSDSQCACNVKGRAIDAMNKCGYGIISCTDTNVNDILSNALGNMTLPICTEQADREFFTKYKINKIYFSAEADLRKCKTTYIDEFFAEMKRIDAELDTCITKTSCSQF